MVDPYTGELEIVVNAAPAVAESSDARLSRIERALGECVGKWSDFPIIVGNIIRDAVDYVIDAPVMRRYSINDLQADEKTTIGKRIENLIRLKFNIPYGNRLDLKLAGEEVDIKTTCTASRSWMFAPSNRNCVNLLVAYDEGRATFDFGMVLITDEMLGSENRDKKRGMRGGNKKPGLRGDAEPVEGYIRWLFNSAPYPPNFLAGLSTEQLDFVLRQKSGMARVRALLSTVQATPIPRRAIEAVANQKDPLRRTRKGGGARDLWPKGIMVLGGDYLVDRSIARRVLGIELADGEFLSLCIDDPRLTRALVNEYAHNHKLSPVE